MTDDPIFYTVDDVCQKTRLGATFVRSVVRRGDLRAVHFGRALRIARSDFEEWIQKMRSADADDARALRSEGRIALVPTNRQKG